MTKAFFFNYSSFIELKTFKGIIELRGSIFSFPQTSFLKGSLWPPLFGIHDESNSLILEIKVNKVKFEYFGYLLEGENSFCVETFLLTPKNCKRDKTFCISIQSHFTFYKVSHWGLSLLLFSDLIGNLLLTDFNFYISDNKFHGSILCPSCGNSDAKA